ncbi:hypothetical protein [uncultured Bacteroides sp.]|uniref:hypothetical protein n=1 Tax=uncultured Bacteroides sp. TaxID=162156 RepID=UPI0025F2BDE8|nr:hypothetical protein [uncultured Bacteroides sp.]
MKKEISSQFWDFIEKCIPDHSGRADFLRQSELQSLLDGHESSLQGTISLYARRELDKILGSLYFEAIDNHINGIGVNCDKCHKFMGKCSYCPHCGKKLVPNEQSQLRITEDVGDVMDVYLSLDEYPETYKKKHTELVLSCGMTEKEATELLKKSPIQLELFYSMDQGLFAVESEAVECSSIYNPYTGAEVANDNL